MRNKLKIICEIFESLVFTLGLVSFVIAVYVLYKWALL